MSSFAALPIDAREVRFDALIAASGKCLEGVPGMGFVFIRKAVLDGCAGNSHSLAMDLHDQHQYMEKTGQWRFTPPTHVVVALAEAIAQFVEGRRPARATGALHRQLPHAGRRHGRAGLQALPGPDVQAPDHRHLPRAGAPGLRLQALLRRRPRRAASSSTRASSRRWRPSASAASAPSAPTRCARRWRRWPAAADLGMPDGAGRDVNGGALNRRAVIRFL
jgi:hypothetical protein